MVKSEGPDDLFFQSVVKGTPMRDNNILSRHIKPAGRQSGHRLGELAGSTSILCDMNTDTNGWRRCEGCAGLMRHSRASTTQDVYQQLVPESQRKAVRKLALLAAECVVQ